MPPSYHMPIADVGCIMIYIRWKAMRQRATVFQNGRSQAVRLPAAFRFDSAEVYIRKDPRTGDVVLSRKPGGWKEVFRMLDSAKVPDDFLEDRHQGPPQERPDL